MPRDTFFNLPDEKRTMIEAFAINEFAARGFDNASINRIVEQSHIAKGSFYQYFDDKKDLFKHLIMRIGQDKLKFMSPVLLNPESVDFFTLLRELYQSGLAFARSNPRSALLANQVFINKTHPVYKEILDEGRDSSQNFFEPLLKLAIDRGEIKADIDMRFVSHILTSLNLSIFEYYFDVVKKIDFDVNNFEDDILHTINLYIDFIKSGLSD
jgi:AcrR family transcriptional regulator